MCTAWVSVGACVCRASRCELHSQEPSCLLHKVLQCGGPAASLGFSRQRGPGADSSDRQNPRSRARPRSAALAASGPHAVT